MEDKLLGKKLFLKNHEWANATLNVNFQAKSWKAFIFKLVILCLAYTFYWNYFSPINKNLSLSFSFSLGICTFLKLNNRDDVRLCAGDEYQLGNEYERHTGDE